jgi:hypothetical protein
VNGRTGAAGAAIALVIGCAVLSGCGERSGADRDPGPPDAASCADTWILGNTLPAPYDGCWDAEGNLKLDITYGCDGGSPLTTYEGRYFGRFGGQVEPGPKAADGTRAARLAKAFADALTECTAPDLEGASDPAPVLRAAVNQAGLSWRDDIDSYLGYAESSVIVDASTLSESEAKAMCSDLAALAGHGDVPRNLELYIENAQGDVLAICSSS